MKQLTVDALVENIETVLDFLHEQPELEDCSPKQSFQIDLAVDEWITNVSSYAYPGRTGKLTVTYEYRVEEETAVITVEDTGVPFDPLTDAREPDLTASVEDREIGGLGIFLVRKNMDSVEYQYRDGANRITMKKKLG